MSKLLTEDLIASVKSRSLAPTSQKTWTDNELTDILNEELFLNLVPDIYKTREDYFKTYTRVSLVSGQYYYRLPERALGDTLEDVVIIDNSGNRWPLNRYSSRDIPNTTVNYPNFSGYCIEGTRIRLIPQTNMPGSFLEFRYSMRISKLVPTTRVAQITGVSVGGANTTFTVDTDLTAILSASDECDFYTGESPFSVLYPDVVIGTITATTVIVPNTSVDNEVGTVDVSVGDYVSLPSEANMALLPEEFDPIIAQLAAVYILEAFGRQEMLGGAYKKLEDLKRNAFTLMSNRVENTVKHIIPRGGFYRRGPFGVNTIGS